MKHETFVENSAGHNDKGHTISQTHQAYKNSDGVKRVAEERMLNDRGHKLMKEKRNGHVEESHHYFNLDEQDVGRFHEDWGRRNKETKFLENVGQRMQELQYAQPSQQSRALGYDRRQPQPELTQSRREARRDEPVRTPQRVEAPRSTNTQPPSRGSQFSGRSRHSRF